jgi:small subunit ribosomal protein S6
VNYYEMMVLFSSTLTDEEEKEQSRQVEDLLNKEKATIHLQDHWGKKKLAYPIKKQRQAYYEWYYLEIDPSRVSEIDRKLKQSEETILRFMILKMEKIQIGNLHKEITRRSEAAQAAQAVPPAPEPAAVAPEPVHEPAEAPAVEQPVAETTPESGQEG